MRTALRALAAALVLGALAATPAAAQVGKNLDKTIQTTAPADYLSSAAARTKALDKLFAKIGAKPRVSYIAILPEEIEVRVQNPKTPYYTDAWHVSRVGFSVLRTDIVEGPRPLDTSGIGKKQEESFFDLAEVNMAELDRLVDEAKAMAQMQEEPKVSRVGIARVVYITDGQYGDVEIDVELSTERESATITANADAQIISADLSGTTRMQRLDLIADNDWPMDTAQEKIDYVLGSKRVHELRVYNTYLFLEAEHPSRDKMIAEYSWDLGGVRQGVESEDYFAEMRDTAPFAMDEIDLTKLPAIKEAALNAFGSPGATITYIEAEKPTDRAGQPQLLWEVDMRQTDGEEGKVLLDAKANVVEVRLPESRAAAELGPWLAPDTVAKTLKRLVKEFGPDAKYGEILINDTQGSILVEDPQAPGKMANFIIDAQSVTRFGEPMPWESALDPSRAFTIGELASLDAATIGKLEQRTLERMKLEGAAVFRYTISKAMLMMSPNDDRLLVEVRAGKDDGWVSGWVTYDLEGAEADVMLP